MMPAALGAPVRYLIIVAHEHADLLAVAERRFAGDPNVEVLVDRRLGERRRHAHPVPWDRRGRQRRAVTDFWADLRFHPVVLATRRDGVGAPHAPPRHDTAAAPSAPRVAASHDGHERALGELLRVCQRAQAVLDEIRGRLALPPG